MSVLLGNGDGTFRPAATYPSGGYDARSVAVADINHDGKADIVVANICAGPCFFNGEGNFGVLLGNGDGTFQDVVTHDDGGNDAFSVAIADLNKEANPMSLQRIARPYREDLVTPPRPACSSAMGMGPFNR